uniref:Uncharacterized protein n=1 Tax=Solanum tuberosum TaxID=4113 RepID=M1BUT4_SOLTU
MVVLVVSQPPAGDKTPLQHIQNTTDSTYKPTYVAQLQANSSTRPISKTELKPIKFIHGEPTIEFTMDEVNEFSIEEGLHQSKSNKEEEQQLVPDDNSGEGRDSRNNLVVVRDATVDRAVANSSEEATTFNSNNEENLENKGKSIEAARRGVRKYGVLSSPNVVASKQDNSLQETPIMNGLWSHIKNGVSKSSNNQILYQNNCTEVELDRSNIVIECKSQPVTGVLQHTQNSTQFDKDINNSDLVPRDLNKNREHVNQQVALTYENEFIVTQGIAGKEISPNTPIMPVSHPEEANNGLNVSKEKQKETSASKWAYLVEEEENITSPPMSKLSPQAPEFVPTSKAKPSMAMTVESFKKSLAMNTKDIGVLAKSHDPEVIVSGISPTAAYDIDLGTV